MLNLSYSYSIYTKEVYLFKENKLTPWGTKAARIFIVEKWRKLTMKTSVKLSLVEKAIKAYQKLHPVQSTAEIGIKLGVPSDYNKAP